MLTIPSILYIALFAPFRLVALRGLLSPAGTAWVAACCGCCALHGTGLVFYQCIACAAEPQCTLLWRAPNQDGESKMGVLVLTGAEGALARGQRRGVSWHCTLAVAVSIYT